MKNWRVTRVRDDAREKLCFSGTALPKERCAKELRTLRLRDGFARVGDLRYLNLLGVFYENESY